MSLQSCGSPPYSLKVADTFFSPLRNIDGEVVGQIVVVSDRLDTCDGLGASEPPPASTLFTFFLEDLGDDGTRVAPDVGDYEVWVSPEVDSRVSFPKSGKVAFGQFFRTGADGSIPDTDQNYGRARTGNVHVASWGTTTMAGDFKGALAEYGDSAAQETSLELNARSCDVETQRLVRGYLGNAESSTVRFDDLPPDLAPPGSCSNTQSSFASCTEYSGARYYAPGSAQAACAGYQYTTYDAAGRCDAGGSLGTCTYNEGTPDQYNEVIYLDVLDDPKMYCEADHGTWTPPKL